MLVAATRKIARSFLQKAAPRTLFPRFFLTPIGSHDIADLSKQRPRRPKNSYLLFVDEVRDQLKDEFPDIKPVELRLLVSEQYRCLSEERKKEYKGRADELLAQYRLAKDQFMRDLNEAQKRELANFEKRMKEKRTRAPTKVDDGKPKKPMSAYTLFVSEFFGSEEMQRLKDQKTPMKDRMKLAGQKWKALSDEEKESYMQRVAEMRGSYAEEMAAWKEQHPLQPKKSLSPYNIFVRELFVSGAFDGEEKFNVKEKMASAATRWKELTEEEKAEYKAKAIEDKERYEAEVLDFEKKYGPMIRSRAPAPKKPFGPFALFTQEEIAQTEKYADKEPREVLHEMAELWKGMAEKDKHVYADKAETDRIRYDQEYKEWRAAKLASEKKLIKRRRKTSLL